PTPSSTSRPNNLKSLPLKMSTILLTKNYRLRASLHPIIPGVRALLLRSQKKVEMSPPRAAVTFLLWKSGDISILGQHEQPHPHSFSENWSDLSFTCRIQE